MTQGSTFYVYDPWGRRIWKQWTGQTGANECEAYFYGATGQKLESYSCEYTPNTIDWFTTLRRDQHVFRWEDAVGEGRGSVDGPAGERTGQLERRELLVFPVGRGARDGDGGWADEVCGILSGSCRGRIMRWRGIIRRRRGVFGVRIRVG